MDAENLDDEKVHLEEEGRRSRTDGMESGWEWKRSGESGEWRWLQEDIHPVPKGYLPLCCSCCSGAVSLKSVEYSPGYTFGVQVLRGGTGASGEHGVHGVPRWICYDRKDGTDGDETRWKQLKGRNDANLGGLTHNRPDSVN